MGTSKLFFSPVLSFLLLLLAYSVSESKTPQLTVKLNRGLWKADESGRLEFTITITGGELRSGDRIAIGIPGSWVLHAFHPDERYGKTFAYQSYAQLTRELAQYFSVESEVPGIDWRLEIAERDIDGRYHRFSREAVLTLASGRMQPEDKLLVSYGTSAHPIHASFLAESVKFPVKLQKGNGNWVTESTLEARTTPGKAEKLLVTADSQGIAGNPVRIHITARDRFGNPARLPTTLDLRSEKTGLQKQLKPRGESHEIAVPFPEPGFYTVEAGGGDLGYARSNPILITETEPSLKLYWGDLHSHSHMSKDGVGHNPFRFARDYSNLDFYARTEHSTGDREDPGVTDEEWEATIRAVRAFNEPGRFVTLLAYECSLPHPYGHHNVYFGGDEAPIYRKHEVKTLEELWRRLNNHEAFTVPHHTGIVFGTSGKGAAAVWDLTSALRPLIEIYSGHGQSERLDPSNPLSYDNMIFDQRWKEWFPRHSPGTPDKYRRMTGPHSLEGPHYAQDAWAAGQGFGTIASSDDHTARPGQQSKGLAAVWAPALDRKSIFESLREKRTYGTTGQRIYLSFLLNNHQPGSKVTTQGPPEITVEVYAADRIDSVELVRFDNSNRRYSVARRWKPAAEHLKEVFRDDDPPSSGFYYVRLRQAGLVDGRLSMAWSSPIWVEGS